MVMFEITLEFLDDLYFAVILFSFASVKHPLHTCTAHLIKDKRPELHNFIDS